MRNIVSIVRRELFAYFTSPMAYVVMCFYISVTSLLFALYVGTGHAEARMTDLFHTMAFLTLMVAPVITMALIAQERNLGTIEILLCHPVREWEVAVGKYLAALALFVIIIAISFVYPLIMEKYGDPDWGEILIGYVGLFLAGASFLAIGLFASSLTANQIAAAILATLILLVFWLIGWISYSVSQQFGDLAKHLSVYENIQDFEKGIFDTKPLLFFVSIVFFFIFATVRSLEQRRA
jgi:ABC-2 type transport system permease protein